MRCAQSPNAQQGFLFQNVYIILPAVVTHLFPSHIYDTQPHTSFYITNGSIMAVALMGQRKAKNLLFE